MGMIDHTGTLVFIIKSVFIVDLDLHVEYSRSRSFRFDTCILQCIS